MFFLMDSSHASIFFLLESWGAWDASGLSTNVGLRAASGVGVGLDVLDGESGMSAWLRFLSGDPSLS